MTSRRFPALASSLSTSSLDRFRGCNAKDVVRLPRYFVSDILRIAAPLDVPLD